MKGVQLWPVNADNSFVINVEGPHALMECAPTLAKFQFPDQFSYRFQGLLALRKISKEDDFFEYVQ